MIPDNASKPCSPWVAFGGPIKVEFEGVNRGGFLAAVVLDIAIGRARLVTFLRQLQKPIVKDVFLIVC